MTVFTDELGWRPLEAAGEIDQCVESCYKYMCDGYMYICITI